MNSTDIETKITNAGDGVGFFDSDLTNHYSYLLGLAYKLCRDLPHGKYEASDLVQEAMVKAIEHRTQFKEGTNFKAWLCTILRHRLLSEQRKFWRVSEDPDGKIAMRQAIPPVGTARLELADTIKAMAQLPPERQQSLILHARGYESPEISDMLNISPGTVRSRVSRARQELRKVLELT